MDESMVAAKNNYTVDSSHYKAPDYGYEGLKYVKAKDVFNRSKKPGNGPNPVVKVPTFWRKDLPNGIKMIGTESTEITYRYYFDYNSRWSSVTENNTSKLGSGKFFCRHDE